VIDWTRRAAIATLAGGLLPAAQMRPHAGCQTNAWPIGPANPFEDLLRVLAKIKELGYEGFETGFRNVEAQFSETATARPRLEAAGLRFFGTHIFLDQYDPQTRIAPADLIKSVATGATRLGAEFVIASGAPCRQANAFDEDAALRKAAAINDAGRTCQGRQLRFAYHNHAPEFAEGEKEIRFLIQNTDPVLVSLVFDAGHAFLAKSDPAAFLREHHKRIAGVHLRDFRNGQQVPLGQGEFDLQALAAAIRETSWNGWLLNEEERPNNAKPGNAAIEPARQQLRAAFGV
jgi:inosose dehydratase